MIIDCIADIHGYEPKLPGGDLLILAGDYTAADKLTQWAKFFGWLKDQPYQKKVLIAGNHDNLFESGFPKNQQEADDVKEIIDYLDIDVDFEYLCDSGTEYEGLKIWGTPWTPWFHGVNPKCKAFMDKESKLQGKFEKIPQDTDILITHTPPYLILDENRNGLSCGSLQLRQQLDTRIFPKLHFFGHIHEQHGKSSILKRKNFGNDKITQCFNVSHVDENYKPVNKYTRVQI